MTTNTAALLSDIVDNVRRNYTVVSDGAGVDFTANDHAVRVTVYDDATVRVVLYSSPSPSPRVDFTNTDARVIGSTIRALLNA